MKIAGLPTQKTERIKSTNENFILHLIQPDEFVSVSEVVSSICGVPSRGVAIVDLENEWHICRDAGLTFETLRNILQTSSSPETIYITDNENLLRSCLASPDIAHAPLKLFVAVPVFSGLLLLVGYLCIVETEPVAITNEKLERLQFYAKQLYENLDLRRRIEALVKKLDDQKSAYAELEKFSYVASHDLRSPLNNIISLTQLLKDEYAPKLDEDGQDYIVYLNKAATHLAELVEGVLEYSKSTQVLTDKKETFNLPELITQVVGMLHIPANFTLHFDKNEFLITTSKIAVEQILLNLFDNAIKHNDKPDGNITITYSKKGSDYVIAVTDNGPGIADEDKQRVFDLFEQVRRRTNETETVGVGLSVVKTLLLKLGGSVDLQSVPGAGATFFVRIPA
jgi:signal transduction histidine kinase